MKIIDADKLHYKQVYIQTEKGLRPALVVFAKEIRKMPEMPQLKAQVDPVKHGRWVNKGFEPLRCSVCGITVDAINGIPWAIKSFNYCPNCGAYMGVEDETD